jgi:methionyl-tRNA formyltransferase
LILLLRSKAILLISSAEISSATSTSSPPGTILESATALRIACKEGSLLLNEVQLEGKKKVGISEFLKGNHLATGLVVGI